MANAILNFHFDYLNTSLSWRTGKHLHVLHVLRTSSTCSCPGQQDTTTYAALDYLLHIFLLSLLFISFYPFEMNVVKRWNSDEDNSAEVWYPLPGCVHNRKIGSGAGCEARRWKFMNNEGGLSLPKVPNLTFPWFGNGEFFFFKSLSGNVCSLYVAEEHLIYFAVNKMYKLQREKKWWVYNGANQRHTR